MYDYVGKNLDPNKEIISKRQYTNTTGINWINKTGLTQSRRYST